MSDADYWKKRYQSAWNAASARENRIVELIRQDTGWDAEGVGLGTGSTGFLSGSAASRGYERGAADLHVIGTNVYLEVTGPQSKAVRSTAALWIRPDKIENARKNRTSHETWIVHCLADNTVIRVIRIDEPFFRWVDTGVFPIVSPVIRNTRETYLEISAQHTCVKPWYVLAERLRELKKATRPPGPPHSSPP